MTRSMWDWRVRSCGGGLVLLGALTAGLFWQCANADTKVEATVNNAIEALESSDAKVQKSGIDQLRSMSRDDLRKALPALAIALQSKDAEVREGVIRILDDLGAEAAPSIPALVKIINGIHDDERRESIDVIGKMGPEAQAAVPALIEALDDKEQVVRDHAIEALAAIGSGAKDAIPGLMQVLKEGALTSGAEKALAAIGPEAIPALQEGLTDRQASCRRLCVTALRDMKVGSDSVVPIITTMLRDKDFDVAREACWALEKIGPSAQSAVPNLIEEMRSKNEYLRCFAADALGAIGPAAKDALPVLKQALNDESVRRYARSAIKKIELGDTQ